MQSLWAKWSGRRRLTLALSVAVGLTLGTLALVSCSAVRRTVVAPPMIEGASFVGNKACFECHTNISRHFNASAHARVYLETPKMRGEVGCESCHGPGSKHITGGGGRGKFIINPGKDPGTCFTCHLQTHAEFSLPQRHPVIEGRLNCVQCHDPHGSDIMKPAGTGLAMARLNETCAQCHREQAKMHVFEHEALREGCTACHVPHGSVNPKLLTERDNNLCLKCHAQNIRAGDGRLYIGAAEHTTFVSRGACWSAGCHPAVHGSSVSPRMHY